MEARFVDEALPEPFRRRLVQSEFINPERMPQRPQAGLSLCCGNTRLESRNQCQPDRCMIGQVTVGRHPRDRDINHAHRDKHARLVAANHGVEVLRRHAENGEGVPIDENGLAYDVRRRAKARLPIAVAQNQYRIGILGRVVLRSKQLAQRRPEAEHLKVVAGDDFCVLTLRLVMPRDAHLRLVGRKHAAEYLVLIAQVLVHRVREVGVTVWGVTAEAAHGPGEAAAPIEANQFLRPLNRQHAQQRLIEKCEHSRIRANAKRKRNNHSDRKCRRLAQLAQRVANILN